MVPLVLLYHLSFLSCKSLAGCGTMDLPYLYGFPEYGPLQYSDT